MIITYFGEGKFEIKTSKGKILTGEKVKINDFSINESGEYEISGIETELIDNIAVFRTEGISITYLDKRKKPLSEKEIERISNIDILFTPVGGEGVFSVKESSEAINQIEPKIVIPMYYQDLTEFCKEEGVCAQPQDQLKISHDKLPTEEREIIVLRAR